MPDRERKGVPDLCSANRPCKIHVVSVYIVSYSLSCKADARPLSLTVTKPRIVEFTSEKVNPGQPAVFNCTVSAFPTPKANEIRLQVPDGRQVSMTRSVELPSYGYTRKNTFRVSKGWNCVRISKGWNCVRVSKGWNLRILVSVPCHRSCT